MATSSAFDLPTSTPPMLLFCEHEEIVITRETPIQEMLQKISTCSKPVLLKLHTNRFNKELASFKNRISAIFYKIEDASWLNTGHLLPLVVNNASSLEALHLESVTIKKDFVESLKACNQLAVLSLFFCSVDDRRRYREDRPDPEGYINYTLENFFYDLAESTGNLQTLSLDGRLPIDYIINQKIRAVLTQPVLKMNTHLRQVELTHFIINDAEALELMGHPSRPNLTISDCSFEQQAASLILPANLDPMLYES